MSTSTRSRLIRTLLTGLASSFILYSLSIMAPFETPVLASPQQQGSPQQPIPTPAKTDSHKKPSGRKANLPVSESESLLCNAKMAVHSFVVDATGNVSDTGRSFEGPACVQVYYPAVQYKVTLSQATLMTKGPDPSSVVMGLAPTSGGGSDKLIPQRTQIAKNVSNRFSELSDAEDALRKRLAQTKNSFNAAMDDQAKAISAIKNML